MSLADNMWLLLGTLLGIVGGCAVAYVGDVIERLILNRRAPIAPRSSAERSALERWAAESSPLSANLAVQPVLVATPADDGASSAPADGLQRSIELTGVLAAKLRAQ